MKYSTKKKYIKLLRLFRPKISKPEVGIYLQWVPLIWLLLASVIRYFEELFNFNTETFLGGGSNGNLIQGVLGKDSKITSSFGVRGSGMHKGIDIRANTGDAVYSAVKGKVISVRDNINQLGGRNILIETEEGVRMFVCHLSEIKVKKGQKVEAGQLIGRVGGSGKRPGEEASETAYAPHLHLEIHKKNAEGKYEAVNPATVDMSSLQPSTYSKSSTNKPKTAAIVTPNVYTGSNNENILNTTLYFMKVLGLTAKQSCGIVGNLLHESGLNPHAYNSAGGGQGAQGIAQWRGPRIKHYKRIYGLNPKDDGDLNHQVEFVYTELKGSSVLTLLKATTTIDDATEVIFSKYERPNDDSLEYRIGKANHCYYVYQNSVVQEVNTLPSQDNYSSHYRLDNNIH